MKFLVPNYKLPPEPLTSGLPATDPRSLCPQLNLLTPPKKKFLGTPLAPPTLFHVYRGGLIWHGLLIHKAGSF